MSVSPWLRGWQNTHYLHLLLKISMILLGFIQHNICMTCSHLLLMNSVNIASLLGAFPYNCHTKTSNTCHILLELENYDSQMILLLYQSNNPLGPEGVKRTKQLIHLVLLALLNTNSIFFCVDQLSLIFIFILLNSFP